MRIHRSSIGLKYRDGVIEMAYEFEEEASPGDTEWHAIVMSEAERVQLAVELLRGTGLHVAQRISTGKGRDTRPRTGGGYE
jgi:dihydroorotase-like cyclic amidohydrolase